MSHVIASRSVVVAAVLLTVALCACDSQSSATDAARASATARPLAISAAPSVKPSPSKDPGQVAMTKFFALATNDGFAYQATFTGSSHHTADILPIGKGLLQVNGDDVRVLATFTHERSGARIVVEHRAVGGRGWIRYASEAWQSLGRMTAADSMAAFAAVHAPPDMTYVGPIEVGGKTVYQVSMASVIVNPIMIPFTNLTERAVTESKLVLVIDAAGRPLSGTATITGRGRISGQLQQIVIELKLTFLKVGQKVTIAAP